MRSDILTATLSVTVRACMASSVSCSWLLPDVYTKTHAQRGRVRIERQRAGALRKQGINGRTVKSGLWETDRRDRVAVLREVG